MSNNVQIVKLNDGREVCLSYGVPVAAFVPSVGYVRTEEKFSVTTSRHASTYAGKDSLEIHPAVFASLVAPVVAR